MSEYIKDILNTSRHQFIYTKNSNLYKNIKLDQHFITISNNNLMFPDIDGTINDDSKYLFYMIIREYLNFSIAYEILNTVTKSYNDINYDLFLNRINKLFKNKSFEDIKTIKELLNILNISKNFYTKTYNDLLKNTKYQINIDNLHIPFLDLISFIDYFKQTINYNNYISIIFYGNNNMSLISQMAINELITKRINKDLSIKVICNIDDWKTYYDFNGILAENIHDYESINLDKNIKTLTKKR